jgi:ssRNA-specific RNase YbeY (16S rRNA maturation enzyme)
VIHKAESPPKQQKQHSCGTTDWEMGWEKAFNYHQKPHLRVKRSEVKHRFMEVLVVVDKKFLDHHKNDDPERYILTIMNMVSDYYHDASMGQQIDVVVVRIIRLEEEKHSKELNISSEGEKTLESFCKWQNAQNSKDVGHHDTAILLTRQDLCSDGSCGLLGLAYVASVCVPENSCAVNEDNGLQLGVTITHEIGHLMGCDHDDEKECSAVDDKNFNQVMAPSVSLATGQFLV